MRGKRLLYDVINRQGEVFQRVRIPGGRALEGFDGVEQRQEQDRHEVREAHDEQRERLMRLADQQAERSGKSREEVLAAGPLLRWLGFRRALVFGALGAAAVTAIFALLDADTPIWIVVTCVLASGCVRSIQYLALNTISFADVPSAFLSRSTSVSGVFQQLARGFGVAFAITGAAFLLAGIAWIGIPETGNAELRA